MVIHRNAVPVGGTRSPAVAGRAATGGNGFRTGASGRQKSEVVVAQVNEAQEVRGQGLDLSIVNSYRFRMQEGEEADVIVLDASLDTVLFADEHHMKDANGKWNVFEFCPKEYDHCCLCDGIDNRQGSYTMYLTLLDLRGIQRRDGTSEPHIKRLCAVKTNLHAEFFKLHDAAVREFGTMRGMQLLMARDGTINSSIGHPIMLANGKMFDMISEADLQAEFGHPEIREEPTVEGQLGRLVKAENYDITAFQYTRLFKQPTGEDLRRRYGAGSSAPSGSREDVQAGWAGAEQRLNNSGPNETRVRTRSQLSPDGGFNAGAGHMAQENAGHSGPVSPGSIPRTRSRVAGGATQEPSAPAAGAETRQRVRTAPVTAATPTASPPTGGPRVIRRAQAGTVANDLDGTVPF